MPYKQVIVVRRDIKMSCGKIAAQVAHAALMAYEEAKRTRKEWVEAWLAEGQKKVVLQVNTLNELLEIYRKAKAMKLPAALVQDAGHTELPPGTITCVAIGPAPEHEVDKITGKLKLLR